ncbi:MAG TPA: hypothetical protein ENL20_03560 [Candidatus Cloacimonetes bacterium]|nr:hypothetical protein [Candidatus Cloacimonadota bacterium]
MKKLSFLVILIVVFSLNLFSTSIGWGNLQWPFSISIVQGETTENIYGQVWMAGVTDSPGEGEGITAELGYGTDGSTPDETWTWFAASYFGDAGGGSNDEYIYNLVCSMAAGEYDYTYRYQFTGDTDYYYAAEIGNLTVNDAPPPTYDVTFQVDMQHQTVSEDGVFLAGSFNGWNPTATPMDPPTRDNVYTVTLELESAYYEYKYINGSEWESISNRTITTPEENHVIPVVFFNDFAGGTSQAVDVTFQVYMGELDSSWYAGGVSVQGSVSPLDWTPGSKRLTDPDEDLVYTATITFPAGSAFDVDYKFTRDDGVARTWWWEDCNNRPFTIDDSAPTQILDLNYWNDTLPVPQNVTTTINVNDVEIYWDAVFGDPSYNVYRSEDPYGDFGTPINPLPLNTNTYNDENAALVDKYFYEVKAIIE